MAKTQITAEPGIPQIIMTCEFDAPRELVFRAYTEPELLQQWLGPRDLTMAVKENDVRDGGKWRFVHTDAHGHEHGFHGVFHGNPSPAGIVRTLQSAGRVSDRRDRRHAGVAKLVDAPALGAGGLSSWGFESLRPHHVMSRDICLT